MDSWNAPLRVIHAEISEALYRRELHELENIYPPQERSRPGLAQLAEEYNRALNSDNQQTKKHAINSLVDRVLVLREGNTITAMIDTSPLYALAGVPPREFESRFKP